MVALREIRAADTVFEQHITDKRMPGGGFEKNNMTGCVARAMQHFKPQ